MPPPALPTELLAERDRVDAYLARFLDEVLERVTALHPALDVAADEVRAFVLGGGKRLRPLFLLTGYVAAGGTSTRTVLGAATALELLHTCALLHDDVIDGAATRRGRPSTHEAFAERHAERGYRGDPAEFGRAIAILLGDLAFVHADEAFLRCETDPRPLLDGLRAFTTLREEVMAGQYLDVVAAHRQEGSSELALRIASLKSGRYTVARPLELGAILAGDGAAAAALLEIGLPVGVAFQLRDDLLGVFGREDTTGKSADSDLAEGKRTLLVTETLARLDDDERHVFLEVFGDADLDDAGAQRLRDLMISSGGRAAVEARIDELTEQARRRLATFTPTAPADAWLDALMTHVTQRTW